jgi:hypothetical protein
MVPHRAAQRSAILLGYHAGESIAGIGRRLGMTRLSVTKWVPKALDGILLTTDALIEHDRILYCRITGEGAIDDPHHARGLGRPTWIGDGEGESRVRADRVVLTPMLDSFKRNLSMLRIRELSVVSLNSKTFRDDTRDHLSNLLQIAPLPIRYFPVNERQRAKAFAEIMIFLAILMVDENHSADRPQAR